MGRIDFDRDDEIAEAPDREASATPEVGSPTMLLQTFEEDSYPVEAARVYACQPATVAAPPDEGAAATVAAGDGVVYAANLGTAIPPVGTFILGVRDGGAWVFRYDE